MRTNINTISQFIAVQACNNAQVTSHKMIQTKHAILHLVFPFTRILEILRPLSPEINVCMIILVIACVALKIHIKTMNARSP